MTMKTLAKDNNFVPNGEPKVVGPGPSMYNIRGCNRKGKFTNPAYSIARIHKFSQKTTPGPAQYRPMLADKQQSESSPSFSFTTEKREVFRPDITTPSPIMYKVPPLLGGKAPDKKSAQVCTIKHRTDSLKINPTPGFYNVTNLNVFKKKSPAFGISHTKKFTTKEISPGPTNYKIGSQYFKNLLGKTAPQVSFGVRHSEKKIVIFTKDDMLWN